MEIINFILDFLAICLVVIASFAIAYSVIHCGVIAYCAIEDSVKKIKAKVSSSARNSHIQH